MIEHFKRSLDNGYYVGCISMDLTKAFDCLPHCLLICKLNAYGFSREACTLVASYLSDRKQRVKVGCKRSDWENVIKGVPQGSILGPILFNVFINDIFYFVQHGNLFNYADYNFLSVCDKELNTVAESLRKEGDSMVEWFRCNGMQANTDKFQGL